MSVPAKAIDVELTEEKKTDIVSNCSQIHESLVTLQHNDSRARVYLGRYFEIILTDYITPLNVWLVGHSKSSAGLVENQNNFTEGRRKFINDYITYQKGLEELVAIDCKVEPVRFYEKLENVRGERALVAKDVVALRKLMDEQVKLVTTLKEKI